MGKQNKIETITHTTPLGCSIKYEIRNMFGIIFMTMQVNFDPIEHIQFAKLIAVIEGIRRITSITIDNAGGTYYFGISKDHNPTLIAQSIENEFNNYFKQIKNTLK